MMKFYKCSICGKVMAKVCGPDTGSVCCWMPMREVIMAHSKLLSDTGKARDCEFDDSSCVPPARREGAYFYAQARRYL